VRVIAAHKRELAAARDLGRPRAELSEELCLGLSHVTPLRDHTGDHGEAVVDEPHSALGATLTILGVGVVGVFHRVGRDGGGLGAASRAAVASVLVGPRDPVELEQTLEDNTLIDVIAQHLPRLGRVGGGQRLRSRSREAREMLVALAIVDARAVKPKT